MLKNVRSKKDKINRQQPKSNKSPIKLLSRNSGIVGRRMKTSEKYFNVRDKYFYTLVRLCRDTMQYTIKNE